MAPLFHLILHRPEIPNNTGNIGRTCVALASSLHLIHPLGFDISEKACRRAGLDYWPRLDLREHEDWTSYRASTPGVRRWLLTTRTERSVFDAELSPGDHFVFGSETSGLPDTVFDSEPETSRLALPMVENERSLNVATAVCAVLYEAIRQAHVRGRVHIGPGGRIGPGEKSSAR